MSRRPLHLALSVAGYAGFTAVTVWTAAFLAGVIIPRTVDGPVHANTVRTVLVDASLLLLFAVQHSVMARRPVKAWLRRWIPQPLERTTYVLAADVCLVLLLLLWQPWDGQVWHLAGPAAVLLWLACAAGWALAIASTFAVDHLELLGLRQAGWARPRSPDPDPTLQTGGLHAVVRHPLMTGLLLAFWATPRMSGSHLFLAVATTGYVAVGVWFEERDLRRTFGTSYDAYAARVPALVPGTRLEPRTRRRVS